jgi:chromosome segregation ATPase
MNHEDREEVRQMLTDILSGHVEKIDGQYRVIRAQLSAIEVQTTKTNGRVTELESQVVKIEKDILTLPLNCNQAGEIKEIKKDLEEYRMLKKYPKVGILIILVAA